MSTGHRTLQDLFNASEIGAYVIPDPGNGQMIPVGVQFGVCELTIAASTSETRSLPTAQHTGQVVTVIANQLGTGGSCTINGVTFSVEGQIVSFRSVKVNDTYTWLVDQTNNFPAGSPLKLGDVANLNAAGTNQSTATAIVNQVSRVLLADNTKGVRLPVPTPSDGSLYLVYNAVATNGLKVYPHSNGNINGGSDDAAVTIEGKTLAIFLLVDGSTWASIFTANV